MDPFCRNNGRAAQYKVRPTGTGRGVAVLRPRYVAHSHRKLTLLSSSSSLRPMRVMIIDDGFFFSRIIITFLPPLFFGNRRWIRGKDGERPTGWRGVGNDFHRSRQLRNVCKYFRFPLRCPGARHLTLCHNFREVSKITYVWYRTYFKVMYTTHVFSWEHVNHCSLYF